MKSYIKITICLCALVLAFATSSCSDDFTNTKPQDAISLSAFYATNAQVNASTNYLYGEPWFDFNTKASWTISEMLSGNGRSYSGDVNSFGSFSVTGDNAVMTNGWSALWGVVAQSNALINNLKTGVGASVDQATINNALGEAHVLRAVAYFYLVRIWGPVPIIENNLDYVYSPQVPLNFVDDVYKFISLDLQFGIDNCKKVASGLNGGHVTSGSAKALLSKVALYQKDYQKAAQLSQEVIDSGEFQLLDNYADLFKTENNNNLETIIALQWAADGYGPGNALQASFAYTTSITGTGDGYGVLAPTIDLLNAYEDGDTRRKATIMLPGDHYPEIRSSDGGFTVADNVNPQGSDAAIKKYVVGTPDDNGGIGAKQSTENNTYILRYADVLLVNAEANLRNGNEAAALAPFNMVRTRAMPTYPSKQSITIDDILHERRLEFAIEGDYWYDLRRIDRSKAIQIISNQERGTYANAPKENPPTIYSQMYTPTDDDFTLPYPSVDVAVNKFLTEDPQPYDFGDE